METAGMMRWLLTYADMITLLLAMFILLYAISKINLEKYKKFTEAAAETFGGSKPQPKAGTAQTGVSGLEENLQSAYNTIKGIIDKNKLQDKVQLVIEERGIRMSFMTDGVFFDIGKADLKPDFEKILASISSVVKQITNFIRIEGHTCNIPIDTPDFPSNWELSSRRATNVLRFLIENGVQGVKMSAAGYAETRPLFPNNSDKNRLRNRRVDIIILKSSEGKLEPKAPVEHIRVKPGTWLSIMQKTKEDPKEKKAAVPKEAVPKEVVPEEAVVPAKLSVVPQAKPPVIKKEPALTPPAAVPVKVAPAAATAVKPLPEAKKEASAPVVTEAIAAKKQAPLQQPQPAPVPQLKPVKEVMPLEAPVEPLPLPKPKTAETPEAAAALPLSKEPMILPVEKPAGIIEEEKKVPVVTPPVIAPAAPVAAREPVLPKTGVSSLGTQAVKTAAAAKVALPNRPAAAAKTAVKKSAPRPRAAVSTSVGRVYYPVRIKKE